MAISLIFERRVLFVPKYEGDEEDFYDNTEQAILIIVVCNNSNECIIDINKTNNNNIIIFSLLLLLLSPYIIIYNSIVVICDAIIMRLSLNILFVLYICGKTRKNAGVGMLADFEISQLKLFLNKNIFFETSSVIECGEED